MKWQKPHQLNAETEAVGVFSKLRTTLNNSALSRTLFSLVSYTEAAV